MVSIHVCPIDNVISISSTSRDEQCINDIETKSLTSMFYIVYIVIGDMNDIFSTFSTSCLVDIAKRAMLKLVLTNINYRFTMPPYFKPSFSPCTVYLGWMSYFISFMRAYSSCEERETSENFLVHKGVRTHNPLITRWMSYQLDQPRLVENESF